MKGIYISMIKGLILKRYINDCLIVKGFHMEKMQLHNKKKSIEYSTILYISRVTKILKYLDEDFKS